MVGKSEVPQIWIGLSTQWAEHGSSFIPEVLVPPLTPSQSVPWAKTLTCCLSGLLRQGERRPKLWGQGGQVSMWPICASVSLWVSRSCPKFLREQVTRHLLVRFKDSVSTLEKLATPPVLLCANPPCFSSAEHITHCPEASV